MSLPYPPPERIKTKRRCMFRLPHKRYDCRSLGVYILNGRGYCAAHYDTAWKVQNPVLGTAHDWHFHMNTCNGRLDPYESCRRCGEIRPHEGLPVNPCRGVMPRIVLR